MSEQLFDIAVLAEQGKNLISVIGDGADVGVNAVAFAVADYLYRIQQIAESLEGGASA